MIAAEADAAKRQELEETLAAFLNSGVPLYQIYTNNCDDAARMLCGKADENVRLFNETTRRLTPCGNFKALTLQEDPRWGVRKLGGSTWKEALLSFFNYF